MPINDQHVRYLCTLQIHLHTLIPFWLVSHRHRHRHMHTIQENTKNTLKATTRDALLRPCRDFGECPVISSLSWRHQPLQCSISITLEYVWVPNSPVMILWSMEHDMFWHRHMVSDMISLSLSTGHGYTDGCVMCIRYTLNVSLWHFLRIC